MEDLLVADDDDFGLDGLETFEEEAKQAWLARLDDGGPSRQTSMAPPGMWLDEEEPEEPKDQGKNLMQQIKAAGVAGAIAYAGWELLFWTVSVPVCISAYYGVTGRASLGVEPSLRDMQPPLAPIASGSG